MQFYNFLLKKGIWEYLYLIKRNFMAFLKIFFIFLLEKEIYVKKNPRSRVAKF